MKTILMILSAFICFSMNGLHGQSKETNVFYNSFNWSPDGKTLCFSIIVMENGVFDRNRWEIGTINSETGEIKRLTADNTDDDWPAYSPDGKQIAFQSERDGNSEIYTMDVNGKNAHRLTSNNSKDYHPDWSPAGQEIIFISDRDGNPELYKMQDNGNHQLRLTQTPFREFNPQWSPDAKKIIYYLEKGNQKDQIYITDQNGGVPTQMTTDSTHNVYPSWSNDGETIIYGMKGDLWLMKAQHPAENKIFLKGSGYAKFSPDGKKIAFKKGRWPNAEIWLCDINGNNPVQLTDSQKVMTLFKI
jgi:tol-pal system beta propeller repeat protein TolB